MQEVTAYQDSDGRLYKSRREAIESDFIRLVRTAWDHMPDHNQKGDPVVIARMLVADVYQSARCELRAAIAWFDDQMQKAERR